MKNLRTVELGDIYAIFHTRSQQWALVQVVDIDKNNSAALLDLDGLFLAPPTPEQALAADVLTVDHHHWSDKHHHCYIGTNKVPERVAFVVNKPLSQRYEVRSYSRGWPGDVVPLQIIFQRQWQLIPAAMRKRFKSSLWSNEIVNLGGRELSARASMVEASAGDGIEPGAFDQLPLLKEVRYTGASDTLIEAFALSPLWSKLRWERHGCDVVDLSATNIANLSIDATGLSKLVLSERAQSLRLFGDISHIDRLEVIDPCRGQFLELEISSEVFDRCPDLRLPALKGLSGGAKRLNLKEVHQYYPKLKSLRLWGDPSNVEDFAALASFSELESLYLNDLFGYGAQDFPSSEQLPKQETLSLTSIPKDVGTLAKRSFKHLPCLDVSKLRNEQWLVENLNNPFRGWDGREGITKAQAKKAFTAFKKVNSGIEKGLDNATTLALFSDFIEVFNAMESKNFVIETMEREEIFEVYMALADKAAVSTAQLEQLFEQKREF